jgi:hypothetical protein
MMVETVRHGNAERWHGENYRCYGGRRVARLMGSDLVSAGPRVSTVGASSVDRGLNCVALRYRAGSRRRLDIFEMVVSRGRGWVPHSRGFARRCGGLGRPSKAIRWRIRIRFSAPGRKACAATSARAEAGAPACRQSAFRSSWKVRRAPAPACARQRTIAR